MAQQEIPLSRPDISDEDIAAVVEVLHTPNLSLGPKLHAFEEEFASTVGTVHAIAVNSGTSALHLAIRAFGVNEGDEVITTPFSFIASSNCILFERATPVFVDILPSTLCIDPQKVEAAVTPKTKAIIAVDVFGHLCDWDALRSIAEKHRLVLIEDSCEALGSSKNGEQAGSFGDCAVFGFYPNKQMTTGEGGMFVTDNDDIAQLARSLRNQGRDDHDAFLMHHHLGYNYRLSDINCALGLSQLQRLPKLIAARSQVASWYEELLADCIDYLHLPKSQSGVSTSWFVYVIRLADSFAPQDRDNILAFLRKHMIGCNHYFPPIHLQPLYREKFGFKEGMFPITERIADRTIALPFSSRLTRDEVERVCSVLREGIERQKM